MIETFRPHLGRERDCPGHFLCLQGGLDLLELLRSGSADGIPNGEPVGGGARQSTQAKLPEPDCLRQVQWQAKKEAVAFWATAWELLEDAWFNI